MKPQLDHPHGHVCLPISLPDATACLVCPSPLQVRFYSYDAALSFVRREFPEYFEAYLSLPKDMERADFFRCVACVYGCALPGTAHVCPELCCKQTPRCCAPCTCALQAARHSYGSRWQWDMRVTSLRTLGGALNHGSHSPVCRGCAMLLSR